MLNEKYTKMTVLMSHLLTSCRQHFA